MPVSVTMPRLGESVTEGTVTRWLKQEGDRVEVDEPLLEISTDKVDTEIPSPAAGVLARIVVGQDETAQVGSELAVITGDGDAPPPPRSMPAEHFEAAAATSRPPVAPPAPAPGPAAPPAPAAAQAGSPAPAGPSTSASGPSAGATLVTMPALGESVTEGTVTRWLKQVGDQVATDEPLLEVSTDKVDTEIPAPAAGVLLEIRVDQDETADVGAVLAVIGAAGASTAAAAPTPARSGPTPLAPAPVASGPVAPAPLHVPATAAAPASPPNAPSPPVTPRPAAASASAASGSNATLVDEPGYVTPLVRKLAAEHGIDLSRLTGTGVGGRIRRQDVLDAAAPASAGPDRTAGTAAAAGAFTTAAPISALRGHTEKISRMRALIAKRMVESLQTSAQLTTVAEVDVTKIAKLRDQAKAAFLATHGVKLTFLPFFALAAVEALRLHPVVNASIDMQAGTITYHDAEHLGVAVDTERGLMVPVIHHAGDLNLAGLAKRISDLAERTRTNKITPDELSGGTFTLTNTGSRGALFDTPIINQPQVAILGTGAVVKRAMVVEDLELGELIAPRSIVYLAISYDHRLIDGADAARFLAAMKVRLQDGGFEAELGL